jgi:hypothetical protein
MPATVPGQLLAAIKARKFGTVARLFSPQVDFQGWTPAGHWVAEDATTAGRIIEVWYSPGTGSTVVSSSESTGARGAAILELEIAWTAPPDEQPRILRQAYLLTVKNGKITRARVYCAGLHTEFPEVDIEKQRRTRGLAAAVPKPAAQPRAAAAAARSSA